MKKKSKKTVVPYALSWEENNRRHEALRESWAACRTQGIDWSVVRFVNSTIAGGLQQLTAIDNRDGQCSFGYVQFVDLNPLQPSIMVMDSYVKPFLRRLGFRTKMHEFLALQYPVIVSIGATVEGKAWMEATGYEYDESHGWWVWRRK